MFCAEDRVGLAIEARINMPTVAIGGMKIRPMDMAISSTCTNCSLHALLASANLVTDESLAYTSLPDTRNPPLVHPNPMR